MSTSPLHKYYSGQCHSVRGITNAMCIHSVLSFVNCLFWDVSGVLHTRLRGNGISIKPVAPAPVPVHPRPVNPLDFPKVPGRNGHG